MKKLTVCLLLICIIGLGCIGLVACNEKESAMAEYVSNRYIMQSINYDYNEYTFRYKYSQDWYKQTDSGKYIDQIGYKLSSQSEYTILPSLPFTKVPIIDGWDKFILHLEKPEDYIDFRAYKYVLDEESQTYDWQIAYECRIDIKDTFTTPYER